MRLIVVECIWTSLEYICTKIHDILKKNDILSQQETEKEGDETDIVSTALPTHKSHTFAGSDDDGGSDERDCLESLETVCDTELSVYVFVSS